ncbi:MAG: hypothetical protein Q9169_003935 [Polycauliona sp. 2 TL-2023]
MAERVNDIEDLRQRRRDGGAIELQGSNGSARNCELPQLTGADAELAGKFGYQPVFDRKFGYLSTFSFAVSISGLFSTIATTFAYPLRAGGASSACIACSVAELVSAYPTCGGLYYTVSRLAPKKWVPSLSW